MSRKRRKSVKGIKHSQRDLEKILLRFFEKNPRKRYNPKQISKKLKIANNKHSVQHALDKLVEKGLLRALEDYKYMYTVQHKAGNVKKFEGKVDLIQSGAAFIHSESFDQDVYIPAKFIGKAFQDDFVSFEVTYNRKGRRPEGQITEIIKRAKKHYIGTFLERKRHFSVILDTKGPVKEIEILPDTINNAVSGDKVIIEVTDWGENPNDKPVARITTILGLAGSSDIEMQSILINNGFNLDFPEVVQQEAAKLYMDIDEKELEDRIDMRSVLTFTIDPLTAKDFDDALSIRSLENGRTEVGIHIADVTHYLKEGSAIDIEASERATSVYLVDRVLPMLPENLSNDLCSLVPNQDRYTFSAIFEFDNKHQIITRTYGKSIIHSDYRFTYEQAQEILEGKNSEISDEIHKLNGIARYLRKKKFKKGAIAFESDEVQFELDEKGFPINIYVKERKEAHLMIEDFMLLANREIATYISKKSKPEEIPFVYRVHDRPDPDKLIDFALFAKEMGFRFDLSNDEAISKSFKSLQEAAKADESLKMLEPLAIRTMSKAVYDTNNIGHYGLSFDFYCHFTSPIRRYADVMVHRILHENLIGSKRRNKEKLTKICAHISAQERKAMEAERESVKFKQAEYFEKHIGETFDGFVNGIIDKGVFVSLSFSKAEGLITFDQFMEPFDVGPGRMKATGRATGIVLRMGSPMKVKIVDVDLSLRQLSFSPVF